MFFQFDCKQVVSSVALANIHAGAKVWECNAHFYDPPSEPQLKFKNFEITVLFHRTVHIS